MDNKAPITPAQTITSLAHTHTQCSPAEITPATQEVYTTRGAVDVVGSETTAAATLPNNAQHNVV